MLSGHLGEGAARRLAIGAIVALFGAGSAAVAMIQTRRLTKSEATGAIVFYFSSVTAVISLVASCRSQPSGPQQARSSGLAAGQRFVAPSGLEFASLAAIGLLGGCGQIMMTHCYRFADASSSPPSTMSR